MSLLKKLAGETAIYGLSSILSRLLNYFILVPFLTRLFLPAEYGIISELYTYIALLMVLFTYRMETTFFRFGSRGDSLDKAFSTASISLIASGVVFGALLLVFSAEIAGFLQYPGHADYVIWASLILLFDTFVAIPFARLRLINRPIRFALIKTLNILVNIFFVFFFLKACPYLIDQGYEGLRLIYDADNQIVYVFIANLMGSFSSFLLLLPAFNQIKWRFDRTLWRKMLTYALPLVIAGIAAVINQLINLPLLKNLLPYSLEENLQQVGIYSACYKLAILMNLFIQAFNYAAEPFFFRHSQREDARNIYGRVGQAFALVGSLVFLGIMLYLDIVALFIGQAFRAGLGIVPILLLAFWCLGLFYNFSIWFKLKDRTIFGAYIAIGGAVITLVLNILLIPQIGYMGSAWAALACYAFMAAASYWTGQRYYPIAYPIGRMFLYIGLALAIYGISRWIHWYFHPSLWPFLAM
ncbi:MAG: polysaccharide biosynthesis C-terminal domain-containing protein, partial [Bacteroidota bacterium]